MSFSQLSLGRNSRGISARKLSNRCVETQSRINRLPRNPVSSSSSRNAPCKALSLGSMRPAGIDHKPGFGTSELRRIRRTRPVCSESSVTPAARRTGARLREVRLRDVCRIQRRRELRRRFAATLRRDVRRRERARFLLAFSTLLQLGPSYLRQNPGPYARMIALRTAR